MSKQSELEKISNLGGETSSEHTPRKLYEGLHSPQTDYEGGACLTHCEYVYIPNNSCSYRWQAVHRAATKDRAIYEEEFTRAESVVSPKVMMAGMKQGSMSPWVLDNGAWEILFQEANRTITTNDGKKQKCKVMVVLVRVIGEPFQTPFSPWANNPHHLLPVAPLLDVIGEISSGKPEIACRILQDLLENRYNINHHVNMMILPQGVNVSYRLGLPTHPKGSKHQNYSEKVKAKVSAILSPYADWTVEKCKNPPKGEGKDMVKKLKRLSKKLHDRIVGAAEDFRFKHKDHIKENGDGKPGSVSAMSINSEFFCALVDKIMV